MSEQNTQSATPEEWLNTRVKERLIKYFNYSNFIDFKNIGEGGFGEVRRATYQIAEGDTTNFALKTIKRLKFDQYDNQAYNKALLGFIKEVNASSMPNSLFEFNHF